VSECRITSAKERRRLRKNAAIGLESAFGARCAHGPCQDAGVHVGGTRVIDNEVLDVRSDGLQLSVYSATTLDHTRVTSFLTISASGSTS